MHVAFPHQAVREGGTGTYQTLEVKIFRVVLCFFPSLIVFLRTMRPEERKQDFCRAENMKKKTPQMCQNINESDCESSSWALKCSTEGLLHQRRSCSRGRSGPDSVRPNVRVQRSPTVLPVRCRAAAPLRSAPLQASALFSSDLGFSFVWAGSSWCL